MELRASWKLKFGLFLSILTLKSVLFFALPFGTTPDSVTYLTVAKNISINDCVSRSNPETRICEPSWGGHHFFGYPLYLSLVGSLDFQSIATGVFIQYLFIATAIFYLSLSLIKIKIISIKVAVTIAFILCLSPLQIGWSRSILTEAMVIPLVILIFTESIKVIVTKKYNYFFWGGLLLVSVFTRYDLAIFCLLVPFLLFLNLKFKVAVRLTLQTGLIVLLPVAAWIYVGYSNGLSFPPKPAMVKENLKYPPGVVLWFRTWSDSTIDNSKFIWKIFNADYKSINIPSKAFANESEKKEITDAIEALTTNYYGKSVPNEIDQKFANIAKNKIALEPLNYYFFLPLKRLWTKLTDFTFTNNLPLRLTEKETATLYNKINSGVSLQLLVEIINQYPVNFLSRAILAIYKLAIYIAVIFFALKLFKIQRCYIDIIRAFTLIIFTNIAFVLTFAVTVETRFLLVPLVYTELTALLLAGLYCTRSGKLESTPTI